MHDIDDVGVFLGLDVGKSAHHGHGLTPAGKKVFDKQLPNSEPKLRAVFDKLAAKFGTVLVSVDQPASIGALPLTVARDAGCKVAYLPGLAMRRIADPYAGEAKTDAKDAAVIADAARTTEAVSGVPNRGRPAPRRPLPSRPSPGHRPPRRTPAAASRPPPAGDSCCTRDTDWSGCRTLCASVGDV